jgi:DNA polymerase-4/DNA polymerase V
VPKLEPKTKSTRERVILHIDGDAFFVGVEVAKNPTLRGKPVVTGEERGIVSALSYEAKAIGITRGMPIFWVKKNFPQVIILPGDYKAYVKYSGMMMDIVRRYADDVEEYSIDECFADLTGLDKPLKMTYREIAERIKKEVNEELQISVSIGLAPTKVLGKVASKWVKPNGLTIITRETAPDFLIKTEIGKIWGIGPRTAELLEKKGIRTAKAFTDKDVYWSRENLSEPYETLWRELRGEYLMEIDPRTKVEYKSVQKTRSFHPATNDKVFLLAQLSKHIEDACLKARHYKLIAKKVSIFLKTKDFKITDCIITLPTSTNVPETIMTLAEGMFKKLWVKGVLYRTVGVTLSELIPDSITQGDLFGISQQSTKFEEVHKKIDALEDKFGKRMVYLASTHKALKNKPKRQLGEPLPAPGLHEATESDDLDRDLLFL